MVDVRIRAAEFPDKNDKRDEKRHQTIQGKKSTPFWRNRLSTVTQVKFEIVLEDMPDEEEEKGNYFVSSFKGWRNDDDSNTQEDQPMKKDD